MDQHISRNLENGTFVAYYSLAMNAINDPRVNREDEYKSLKSIQNLKSISLYAD